MSSRLNFGRPSLDLCESSQTPLRNACKAELLVVLKQGTSGLHPKDNSHGPGLTERQKTWRESAFSLQLKIRLIVLLL